jgi:regulator of sirC expression with transglutaminase-like and TPR domain
VIDIQIDGGAPHLAELIEATLHGNPVEDPSSSVTQVGKLVRQQQEELESKRPSHEQLETVNFALIDEESDWSDV